MVLLFFGRCSTAAEIKNTFRVFRPSGSEVMNIITGNFVSAAMERSQSVKAEIQKKTLVVDGDTVLGCTKFDKLTLNHTVIVLVSLELLRSNV